MKTARDLAAKGCHNFRAGVWKPRTKPGGFEGNGENALPWMKQVKEETGMLVATEVAKPEHVALCMKYGIDILWVGARTAANPFAMQDLADAMKGIEVPVLVKNPVNPDLELWIGAMERLNQAGVKRMAAVHRGFSSFDKKIYRNRCGRFRWSCIAASPICPSSVTPVILADAASSWPRSASRRWTWASTACS